MNTFGQRSSALRALSLLGLVAFLMAPSPSLANDILTDGARPIAANDDPDCEQATVDLEIDVATGNVYLLDPSTGTQTLTDNDITVSFGDLGHVLLIFRYTSSEWDVTVTADTDPPVSYGTTNGWLRYSISDDVDQYTFASSEVTSASSSMMNMTPVIPTITIRTDKNCPPAS